MKKVVKMEISVNIYLSSKITSGARLITGPKLLKIGEDKMFSDLLELLDPSVSSISSNLISKNDKFVRSECQEVNLKTELAVCRHFSPQEPYRFVSFLKSSPRESESPSRDQMFLPS